MIRRHRLGDFKTDLRVPEGSILAEQVWQTVAKPWSRHKSAALLQVKLKQRRSKVLYFVR